MCWLDGYQVGMLLGLLAGCLSGYPAIDMYNALRVYRLQAKPASHCSNLDHTMRIRACMPRDLRLSVCVIQARQSWAAAIPSMAGLG